MTEAQVTEVVASATANGRTFTRFDAAMFLMAKEFVARGPGGEYFEAASQTVANYSRYLTTGNRCDSFHMFEMPCPRSDEEIARSKKLRDEHLAYLESQKDS